MGSGSWFLTSDTLVWLWQVEYQKFNTLVGIEVANTNYRDIQEKTVLVQLKLCTNTGRQFNTIIHTGKFLV